MKSSETLWIGVGVGCSLLLLCGLCIVGGGVVYFLRSGAEQAEPPRWLEERDRPIQPPSTPPPVVGPATPLGPATPIGPGTQVAGGDLRRVRVTVTAQSGLADVPVGSACTADVTRHDRADGTFWCNAQITCGTRLVYGGVDAGFFQCVLYEGVRRDVVGSDAATSAEDQDPAMSLNTVGGTLEVRDDPAGRGGPFQLTARVDAIE